MTYIGPVYDETKLTPCIHCGMSERNCFSAKKAGCVSCCPKCDHSKRALNGDERYKKMWEELKEWLSLSKERTALIARESVKRKLKELESSQEGTKP